MCNLKSLSFLCVGLLFPMVSQGVEPSPINSKAQATPGALTIDLAVNEGLERSPEIQRAKASKSETEWKHFEMLGSGFLPKLSASAYHYFETKYTLTNINFGGSLMSFPGFYPTNTAALNVSVPLFDGLTNIRNLQAASLSDDAAAADLAFSELKVREDIRLAFFKSIAAQELQAAAEQNVKTLDDHLKQVETQKTGGVATTYDVLRVQVQLNEAKADAIDAKDNFENSRRKLTQLMGLESDDRVVSGVLPVPNAEKVKDLKLGNTSVDRPDIKAQTLRTRAADYGRMAQSTWFVPSIYLSGQLMWYDSQLFQGTVQDTGKYLNAYNFGIFLKWNLFDGGVAIAQERQAAYHSIQEEKKTDQSRLQVPYDFEYWKRRYLSNTDHYISKKFDIVRSEESVRLAKEEERAGTRTSTETLDAELDLYRAKAGVINALVNAAEAEIHLELVLGREI